MAVRKPLPASFTSVYRLFLRATSSAVLHQPRTVRNLRRQWKPLFYVAAENMKKLQDPALRSEHVGLQKWLEEWERRVDNTLSLLYNCSQNSGLMHKVIRNLSQLHRNALATRVSLGSWRPDLDPKAVEYQVVAKVAEREAIRKAAAKRQAELEQGTWNALGEVVRMAEGRHFISLGRIIKNES